MSLTTTKSKYRKHQRGRMKGKAKGGNKISYGEYGLQAMECCWMNARQLEAARRALTHSLKRGGKVWIKVFPDKVYTARAAETRMGGGKGAPAYYVAVIKPGHILFELSGVSKEIAQEAMRLAGHKLPIKTRFVAKR